MLHSNRLFTSRLAVCRERQLPRTGMYISQSVGRNGVNQQSDVRTVQALLNFNIDKLTPLQHLKTDGCIGPATTDAIVQFQQKIQGLASPTARIDPSSETLEVLRKAVPSQ